MTKRNPSVAMRKIETYQHVTIGRKRIKIVKTKETDNLNNSYYSPGFGTGWDFLEAWVRNELRATQSLRGAKACCNLGNAVYWANSVKYWQNAIDELLLCE